MNIIRSFLAFLLLSGSLFFTQPLFACACGIATFAPENELVESDGTARALLVWKNSVEHYVIDPGLRGNAQDFGMAVAFPSRPEISKAPNNLFNELFEYTKPIIPPRAASRSDTGSFFGATQSAPQEQAVTVIETKDVGDFTTTVLTATDSKALLEWLNQNGYKAKESDLQNFDYYIQKGGYYFVALKLSTTSTDTSTSDYKLTPIEFTFSTPQNFIPLRLVRGTSKHNVQFTLYTLSAQPLIINGAGLMFSNTLPQQLSSDISSLTKYQSEGSWIIKQNVLLDTTEINEDLVATVWNSPKEMRYTDGEEPFIFHEGAVLKNAGVIEVMYPSELNFGYTAQQKPTPFNDYRPLPETFLEKYGLLLFWFLILLIHLYIGATLFFLARKLSIHHRWRAWLPVFNLSLLVALAGKKWWWFAGICLLPILIAFLIALNSSSWWYYTPGLIDNYPFDWFFDSIQFIFGWIAVMFFFIEYGLLDRIFTSLVARGGRPTWWGPLMILVPPVGLVFLGILAWSKHTPNILNEKIQ